MRSGARKSLLIAAAVSFSTAAIAFGQGYTGPGAPPNNAANQTLWATYCKGTASSLTIPQVNYANADVKAAAAKLSKVKSQSFYYYGPIEKLYKVQGPDGKLVNPPADAPKGTTPNAHAFLVQLCGEFRDRATMVQAKINWVKNIFVLPNKAQGPVSGQGNVWSQLTAQGYAPYLTLSAALFDAKRAAAGKAIQLGTYSVDPPVPAQTVCETKYMISQYVATNKPFDSLASFQSGLANWGKTNCAAGDSLYYYDFRGDSNFKPQSPEGNGMIWYSTSITGHCSDLGKAKDAKIKDTDCQSYFTRPFYTRWNGARAGLATWLLRDSTFDAVFSNTQQLVQVVPNMTPVQNPFSFIIPPDKAAKNAFLKGMNFTASDLGINAIVSAGSFNAKLLYERLRDSVNRHTDWYKSGFTDGRGMTRNQAYSPFVASSYEMSKSDQFTSPGVTVGTHSDGRKHWMFIFRVKKTDWYNSQSIASKTAVDFDRNWFDETSIGTVGLAKSERAFDRLGTALEGELDSILYLHNISTGGQVVGNE
jgi:hypothetical protein